MIEKCGDNNGDRKEEEFLNFQLYAASKFLRLDRENYLKERLRKL